MCVKHSLISPGAAPARRYYKCVLCPLHSLRQKMCRIFAGEHFRAFWHVASGTLLSPVERRQAMRADPELALALRASPTPLRPGVLRRRQRQQYIYIHSFVCTTLTCEHACNVIMATHGRAVYSGTNARNGQTPPFNHMMLSN